jgi:two-component system CheB/CheR fusion protein
MSPRSAPPSKPRRKKSVASAAAAVPDEPPAALPDDAADPAGATPAAVPGSVLIVGVGASAGGLEALSALLTGIRPGPRLAVVVVQHLSPTYRSMLPQLLARETTLVVDELVDGVVPKGGHAYITPPNKNLIFEGESLHLVEAPPQISPKPSINAFFESLAEAKGEDAVGVILSGTGSDGARGIRAIKAAGGMTFAQDPSDAKYAGMPQAAVDTGSVDFVLRPEHIGEELTLLAKSPPVIGLGLRAEPQPMTLKTLLARVRQQTRLDFSGYKETTLWRRIERRMIANRTYSFDDYLVLAQNSSEETEKLAKDILISVTSFFRDRRAFDELRQVIQRIVERKAPGDEIRVWVPGCATGEEAYSIAVLFSRVLGPMVDQYRLQIFATDVDNDAMAIARKGAYSGGSLANIDAETLKKYFSVREDRYEIVKSIRDVVLFARQDLVLDPPFLRLDLISCRNVLIYFQPPLQSRIFALFHYALQADGHLFLGKSESVLQSDDLFAAVEKDARIFRRLPVGRRLPAPAGREHALSEFPPVATQHSGTRRELDLLRSVSSLYLPPGALVNAQLAIQHVFGDISSFAKVPTGKPTQDLGAMLRRDFRVELQTLLHHAHTRIQVMRGRTRLNKSGPAGGGERLAVHPVVTPGGETLFFVCVETVEMVRETVVETAADGEGAIRRKELEDELTTTREHLQTLVEELETQNEEMQALNEEVQASNEELQASNEELEAANEELQSTNEELMTINQELSVKTSELTATNADLESIQNAVGIPVFVIDAELAIVRRNWLASELLRVPHGVVAPGLLQVKLPEGLEALPAWIGTALTDGRSQEHDVTLGERRWQLKLLPYSDAAGTALSLVVTLYDQTEALASREAMRVHRERLLAIMNNSTALIALKGSVRALRVRQRQGRRVLRPHRFRHAGAHRRPVAVRADRRPAARPRRSGAAGPGADRDRRRARAGRWPAHAAGDPLPAVRGRRRGPIDLPAGGRHHAPQGERTRAAAVGAGHRAGSRRGGRHRFVAGDRDGERGLHADHRLRRQRAARAHAARLLVGPARRGVLSRHDLADRLQRRLARRNPQPAQERPDLPAVADHLDGAQRDPAGPELRVGVFRHHRVQGSPAAARIPRAARRSHRAAQPEPVRRSRAQCDRQGRPQGNPPRAAVPRSRQLQEHQRLVRPPPG